jgi:hypothetical protein
MLWAIDRPKRHRALRASDRQLVRVSKAEEELLCHGHAHFGGLVSFSFECPGPCSTIHDIRPRHRQSCFDPDTQRFCCPDCGIELQLSILAEILPPRLSKKRAAEYEANLLRRPRGVPAGRAADGGAGRGDAPRWGIAGSRPSDEHVRQDASKRATTCWRPDLCGHRVGSRRHLRSSPSRPLGIVLGAPRDRQSCCPFCRFCRILPMLFRTCRDHSMSDLRYVTKAT